MYEGRKEIYKVGKRKILKIRNKFGSSTDENNERYVTKLYIIISKFT